LVDIFREILECQSSGSFNHLRRSPIFQYQFADGAEKNGFDRGKAEELFDLIVKFAGYGFNKSHSAAYAMVTFYTSYLKCYYPTEFMAAQLTLEKDNTTKVVRYVDAVKNMGIELLPPDINRSDLAFVADEIDGKPTILFGLGGIKGAGDIAVRSILDSRKVGAFRDLSDFISRIDTAKVNKKVIEAFIKAGALDSLGYSRKAMLTQIEVIMEAAAKATQAKRMAENSLFGDGEEMTRVELELKKMEEFDTLQMLEFEKETLGFYVSGHPLDKYRDELAQIDYTLSSEIEDLADGSQALIIGKIEEITEKISKKGNKFGIANVMDLHGNIELMLFADRLKELEEEFDLSKPIAFKVKVSKDGEFTRLNILKIETLKEARKERVRVKKEQRDIENEENHPPIILSLELMPDYKIIEELYYLAEKNPGPCPLHLHIRSKLADVLIESKIHVGRSIIEAARTIGVAAVEMSA